MSAWRYGRGEDAQWPPGIGGLRGPCEDNPNDPVCQEFYGQGGIVDPTFGTRANIQLPWAQPPAVPPTSTTPIGPGTMVNTTELGFTSFWNKIPMPVKIIGAGLLAFVGYKKFIAR